MVIIRILLIALLASCSTIQAPDPFFLKVKNEIMPSEEAINKSYFDKDQIDPTKILIRNHEARYMFDTFQENLDIFFADYVNNIYNHSAKKRGLVVVIKEHHWDFRKLTRDEIIEIAKEAQADIVIAGHFYDERNRLAAFILGLLQRNDKHNSN